jgi:quercetin dioxygenase-like cupin family protein
VIKKIYKSMLLSLILVNANPLLAADDYPPINVLLSSTLSTLGQAIEYPEGKAKITAAIITMKPGDKTGVHIHNAPLFVYIMEGQVSVDYGKDGIKIYKVGDSFIEAFKTEHYGENTGVSITRILTVYAGAVGTQNTVMEK